MTSRRHCDRCDKTEPGEYGWVFLIVSHPKLPMAESEQQLDFCGMACLAAYAAEFVV